MKSTASAVEISAAKSAASARPPTHGGSTSVVSRGSASSGFARPGSTARIAMPNTAGTNAKRASATALPSAAHRAARAERAPKRLLDEAGRDEERRHEHDREAEDARQRPSR